jgi:arginyl-tRNA synthetase
MIDKMLIEGAYQAFKEVFGNEVAKEQFQLQKTLKEFEGDFTLVVFHLLRFSRKSPEQTATMIGEYLQENLKLVESFNVIKGFLNLVIANSYWLSFYNDFKNDTNFGFNSEKNITPTVIEFSSPNTNKPLHLGHVRNNFLGSSVANILKADGKNIQRVNLVNDRGIHICKSMLAWQKWGNELTPEKANKKGDKLVGNFYVLFDKKNKEAVQKLIASGMDKNEAEKKSALLLEAQTMLKKWESGDEEIRNLWAQMNMWVYTGFDKTYDRMGIQFEKTYYESETYLLGKKIVEKGLKDGILFKKEDGSVWVDLKDEGLDEKLLLRADGTSVYITQDLGTAKLRQDEFKADKLIYVVGNEQNYHFDVLRRVLKKLSYEWAEEAIYHLSYGMVELPHGKMKSREGIVVDADELMEEMFQTAKKMTTELGKISEFPEEEANALFEMVGLGALKYFILKVDPKKSMMFNPEESVDFTGNTGPFIQYTHARIQSLLRKADKNSIDINTVSQTEVELLSKEKGLIKFISEYPAIIKLAAENYNPAQIANYIYHLVKEYNQFYQEIPIFKEDDQNKTIFRLQLSRFCGSIIKSGMGLLGIQVPDRM